MSKTSNISTATIRTPNTPTTPPPNSLLDQAAALLRQASASALAAFNLACEAGNPEAAENAAIEAKTASESLLALTGEGTEYPTTWLVAVR